MYVRTYIYHLSHLPSNTESEHSTAPGSADRPGGNDARMLLDRLILEGNTVASFGQ